MKELKGEKFEISDSIPECCRLLWTTFVEIILIVEAKSEIWPYLLKERRYRLFIAIFEEWIFGTESQRSHSLNVKFEQNWTFTYCSLSCLRVFFEENHGFGLHTQNIVHRTLTSCSLNSPKNTVESYFTNLKYFSNESSFDFHRQNDILDSVYENKSSHEIYRATFWGSKIDVDFWLIDRLIDRLIDWSIGGPTGISSVSRSMPSTSSGRFWNSSCIVSWIKMLSNNNIKGAV